MDLDVVAGPSHQTGMKKKTCNNWKISDRARIASTRSTAGTVDQGFAAARSDSTRMVYREPLKTAVFSPSLTQAVRNPQICLFFVQFRLFLGFFVPHSSRIGPLQAHLGL